MNSENKIQGKGIIKIGSKISMHSMHITVPLLDSISVYYQ